MGDMVMMVMIKVWCDSDGVGVGDRVMMVMIKVWCDSDGVGVGDMVIGRDVGDSDGDSVMMLDFGSFLIRCNTHFLLFFIRRCNQGCFV